MSRSLFPLYNNTMPAFMFGAIVDDLGISVSELAKRLDVDRRTIYRWMNGEVAVPGPVALLMGLAIDAQRWSHEGEAIPTKPARLGKTGD